MPQKFKYICTNCKKEYRENEVKYLCPECANKTTKDHPPKGVLKVEYDYLSIKIKSREKGSELFSYLHKNDYLQLLPIKDLGSLPNLRVGKTPLYKTKYKNKQNQSFNLYLKDDSQNPTYSYKDRASAIVSAYAKESAYETIVAASTGNAGSSLAGICAAQNQKAVIMVPETAPQAKLTQIMMYGARIIPVKGTYDDAFDLSMEASRKFGWYNRNTAYNPLTVEGKKTATFEIFEQLGEKTPDYIFVPVGDGCIIAGVYKGFEDLLKLEIITKIPIIVAVQSEGSCNLVFNLEKEKFTVKKSNTIADSISVDIPRNYYMTKDFIKKYNGESIIVSDTKIMKASKVLTENYGLFSEPAAAASFAGMMAYAEKFTIKENAIVTVLLTGSGLKDLNSVQSLLDMPDAVEPDIDEI